MTPLQKSRNADQLRADWEEGERKAWVAVQTECLEELKIIHEEIEQIKTVVEPKLVEKILTLGTKKMKVAEQCGKAGKEIRQIDMLRKLQEEESNE